MLDLEEVAASGGGARVGHLLRHASDSGAARSCPGGRRQCGAAGAHGMELAPPGPPWPRSLSLSPGPLLPMSLPLRQGLPMRREPEHVRRRAARGVPRIIISSSSRGVLVSAHRCFLYFCLLSRLGPSSVRHGGGYGCDGWCYRPRTYGFILTLKDLSPNIGVLC